MVEVQLSDHTVQLKETLTWGDMQELEAILAGGAKMTSQGLSGYDGQALVESRYKLLEIAVASIKDAEGNKVKYTRDWASKLSVQDGEKLYREADKLQKKTTQVTGD